MKLNKILFCAAMTSILPLQHAFSAPVNRVEVQVIDTNGATSQLLLQKMSSSMQVVADQLFLEKDAAKIAAAREDYARLLTEIGDRVFTGYELTDVQLDVGEATQVCLYARPWNKVIEKPFIDLQFSGVETQTAVLLKQRIPGLSWSRLSAVHQWMQAIGPAAYCASWYAARCRHSCRNLSRLLTCCRRMGAL